MSYVSEVLADNPVAYWRMEETSGTSVADETGNGWTGTVTGANLAVSGPTAPLGSAIEFDGVDDGIDVSSAITSGGLTALTAEFWVYRREVSSRVGFFVQFAADGHNAMMSTDSSTSLNKIQLVYGTGGGTDIGTMQTTSSSVLTVDTWHHVVLAWDNAAGSPTGMARIFLDGVEQDVGGAAYTGTIAWHDLPFYIGRSYTTDRHLDGLMDEVAWYNYALTPARIQAHYDARNTAPPPAPVLSSTGKTATTVDLSWTGAAASEWQVDRDGTTVSTTPLLTFQDTGLSPSTEYSYRVRSVEQNTV